jgi:hypothetical protein
MLLEAQSEADVRQAVLAELPPAPLEHLGIDYLHENLLIEFKHAEPMGDPDGKKVIKITSLSLATIIA